MGRTHKAITIAYKDKDGSTAYTSVSVGPDLLNEINSRALEEGVDRSQYLRILVRRDLEKKQPIKLIERQVDERDVPSRFGKKYRKKRPKGEDNGT